MLRSVNELCRYKILTRDGCAGHVRDLCFDDRTWNVRSLTAETGGWLDRRRVSIAPETIRNADAPARELRVDLTFGDVRNAAVRAIPLLSPCPSPDCWWALACNPDAIALLPPPRGIEASRAPRERTDPHVLSGRAVRGYRVNAWQGPTGHLRDLLVDDETWIVRYLSVRLERGWNAKSVLVATEWVVSVVRAAARVRVGLDRDRLRAAPEYDPRKAASRPYEALLRVHFGRPPDWFRGTSP